MSEAVVVALITGAFSFAGVWIANRRAARDMLARLELGQAVTETRIDELAREVRVHNGFAERVPALEERVRALQERIQRIEGSM